MINVIYSELMFPYSSRFSSFFKNLFHVCMELYKICEGEQQAKNRYIYNLNIMTLSERSKVS